MDDLTTKHLEDLILDNSFQQFVSGVSLESTEKWQLWIKENPQAQKEFDTAITVMKLLLKTKKNISDLNTERDLNELLSVIRSEKDQKPETGSPLFQWWKMAGIIALLISISTLVYFAAKRPTQDITAYNEIVVPLGEKSQLILADGTHIWINSSSKLRYPVNFSKKSRTVFLEGEAYFDVTKNEKQPFIVNTPDLKIKVLGTAFNVKNYPGDKNAITTVVRGLVSVEGKKEETEAVLLNPNENFVLNTLIAAEESEQAKEQEKEVSIIPHRVQPIVNKKVNVEAITSWKDQMLVFSDEPFEEVAQKMERWYNVRIIIQNEELKKERYRGKFVNNETIFQVLEAIKFTTPIRYKVNNNEILIDKPK